MKKLGILIIGFILEFNSFFKYYLYLFFLIVLNINTYSQNLVINGGFEERDLEKKYTKNDILKEPKQWDRIAVFPVGGNCNNYFYINSTVCVPYILPYDGDAYIRSMTPYDKTLFQTKLLKPLKKGQTYCVEFYYRLARYTSHEKPKKEEIPLFNSGDFGVYFSNTDYSDKNKYSSDILSNKIHWKPQIAVTLTDSAAYKDWVHYFTFYTPNNDFSYLIIGNHSPMNPEHKPYLTFEPYFKSRIALDFFIDNVSVKEYSDYIENNKLPENVNIELKNIYFDIDKSEIHEDSFKSLEILAKYLVKFPKIKIEIYGHTDKTGEEIHNIELSGARAKAVSDYLILKGIDKNRINSFGYGSSKPLATNKTEEGKAKNRRIEIKIIK